MKRYWLTLFPETFIWIKGEKGIVYNARNYKKILFLNKGLLNELSTKLLLIDNLYRVDIDETYLSNSVVDEWVNQLLVTESALLMENDGKNMRPVSLMPKLKIQDSIDYYRLEHKKGTNASIMYNLHKLVFHINGSRYGHDVYRRQIIYPGTQVAEMATEDICTFIMSFGSIHFLSEISLVGCLWEYSNRVELLEYLNSLNVTTSIYCTEKDYIDYKELIGKHEEFRNVKYYILISDYKINPHLLFSVPEENNIIYNFVVTSELDYKYANEWIEYYNISNNSKLSPVYIGNNLSFLKDNLYMQKTDIYDICLSKREVFAHQVINTNFFGTFVILPDGKVFSGSLHSRLGKIEDGLYDLVYRELTEGHSWLYIRDQEPCSGCLFQWLCPSPSVYEWEVGKPNLCHILP